MAPPDLPSFAELRRRYAGDGEDTTYAMAAWSPGTPPEEAHGCLIINDLRGLDYSPRTLDELQKIIDDLDDDEISAWSTHED